MAVDIMGLIAVLNAATKEPNLDMSFWKCCSSHCMIGAFCDQNLHDPLHLEQYGSLSFFPIMRNKDHKTSGDMAIAERFGITKSEAQWLFTSRPYPLFGVLLGSPDNSRQPSAIYLSKPQALNRLRKFICYKMTKQLLTLEHARQIGGNQAATAASQYAKVITRLEQETDTND